MEYVLEFCQGLGLALAAGAVVAAPGARGIQGVVLAVIGAVIGGYLFGLSLDENWGVAGIEDETYSAYPGWALGAAFALFSWWLWNDVVGSARARADDAGAGISAYVLVGALLAIALSIFVPFIGALALVGSLWLAFGRQRRSGRKYEGLRTLR
jgi:hypothetical protein